MFVHLRCRSRFTFRLGTLSPEDIARLAGSAGMPAVALVDRNLFGAVSFARACREVGSNLKAIHGLEVMLVQGKEARPLTLLAMSTPAFRRLEVLASRLDQQGQGTPQVELSALAAMGSGLVGICGGPEGWTRHLLRGGQWDEARALVRNLKDALQGRFFLEALPLPRKKHSFKPHAEVVHQILGDSKAMSLSAEGLHHALERLSKETDIAQVVAPLVARGEPYSLALPTPEGSAKDLAGHHWLNEKAMADCFGGYEVTSLAISEKVEPVDLDRRYFLSTPAPDEQTDLVARCREGLIERLGGHPAEGSRYSERLQCEINWITRSTNAGHWVKALLALADLAEGFRAAGLPIGPGSGETPSSLVAWALGIHDTDPVAMEQSSFSFFNPAATPSTRPFPIMHVGLRDASRPIRAFALSRPGLSVPAAFGWQPPHLTPKKPLHFGPVTAHPVLLRENNIDDLPSIFSHLVLTDEAEPFPTWNPSGWDFPIKPAQWRLRDPFQLGLETLVLAHDPALDLLQSLQAKAKASGLDPGSLDLHDPQVIRELGAPSIPGFLELNSDAGPKHPSGADIWSRMAPSSFEEVVTFFALWELRWEPAILDRYLEAKSRCAEASAKQAGPILASTFGVILFDQQLEAVAEHVGLSPLEWNGIMMRFHRGEADWDQVTQALAERMQGQKGLGSLDKDDLLAAIIAPGDKLRSRAHCVARALLLWQIVSLKTRLATFQKV